MKYLLLFHIFPPDIVKIIIDYIKIYHKNVIVNFYRIKLLKEDIIKNFIRSIMILPSTTRHDNYFITSYKYKIKMLDFIINHNWNIKYSFKEPFIILCPPIR